MSDGVKCPKCGLQQSPGSTCKSCGAALGDAGPPNGPPSTQARIPEVPSHPSGNPPPKKGYEAAVQKGQRSAICAAVEFLIAHRSLQRWERALMRLGAGIGWVLWVLAVGVHNPERCGEMIPLPCEESLPIWVWYVGFPLLYLVIGFVGVAGYHSVTNPLRRATAKIMMTRGFLVAVIAGFLGLLGAGIYLSSSGERIWEGKSAALIHAAWNGHTNTVYALLAEGAAVNATTWRGRTALMYAAQRGHPDTLKGLMDRGADVNAKIQDGWTALMLAVANGHADIVKILIERGADVNAKTLRGKTAMMLAASEGHTGIVNVLKSAGAKE